MADTVNLVLYPQVQDGAEVAAVKKNLQTTLSVDVATVDSWYTTMNPTAILTDVERSIAVKYLSAIQECGAECNLQPSDRDKAAWGLELKTNPDSTVLFVCPFCEHKEQVGKGSKLEKCPECGLVIAEWEEKIRKEAEDEKIRRRLMREQRLKGDKQDDPDTNRKELERLRELEREIVKELGIKPPSTLWVFFEKYTISLSFVISLMIVALAGVGFRYLDLYLEQLSHEEAVAAAPSEQIREVARVVAVAVEMQQQGNQVVLTEIVDATQAMRGPRGGARQEIMYAAQQMMKGVNPEIFLDIASKMPPSVARAKLVPGEAEPALVNLETIGGISGLQGVSIFSADELQEMAPPLFEHGHDKILAVLPKKQFIKDKLNLAGSRIVVQAIDEMDGSAVVNLLSSVKQDQEWDQYLLSQVKQYILNANLEAADLLADRIRNPIVRINAFAGIMEEHQQRENPLAVKVLRARVDMDLVKIENPDARAKVILDLGQRMAAVGSPLEPAASISSVQRMVNESKEPLEKSALISWLAVAYMNAGDKEQARRLLRNAQKTAGQVALLNDRIFAFTKLAQRYYDVRNNTLASEILSEASVLAATKLAHQPRSVAFGRIALARAYIGDFVGTRESIDNAADGRGKQQLLVKVVEMLLVEQRFYEALSWMETLEDEVEYSRLELRLSSAFFYAGRTREALNRIEQSAPRMQRIYELSERGLLTSQYARFLARLGKSSRSEQLFEEAEAISKELTGRKSQINLGLVAVNRAKVFQLEKAREIVINELTDSVIREPIDIEVLVTERVIKNLLPEGTVVR
ncbi:MAG: hypothetical protein HOD26_02405 [Gammaproteobacteria bacterium]|nr:hypothetical protein [Gammaproteobacteria bacterium]